MITADGARAQNKQSVERLINEDYDIAVKMINGLIMTGVKSKKDCNAIEIDLTKKESRIICGHVSNMLKAYYEQLGYNFEILIEKHPGGKQTLSVSWEK